MNTTMHFTDGYTTFEHPRMYDWMFDTGQKPITPEESPYGYDAFYLWRSFTDKNDIPCHHTMYSDRMMQADPELYKAAFDRNSTEFGKLGKSLHLTKISKKDAQIICKRYFGKTAVCIGYGVYANRSNGYETGIFLVDVPEE